jgi:hypothetical protein
MVLGSSALGCVDAQAPDKCRDFRDAYCEAQQEQCDGVTADFCTELFDDIIACDDATGVEAEYDDCMADIAALDECPTDLPANCKGVVLFPEDYFEDADDADADDDGGDDAGPSGFFGADAGA